MASTQKRSRLGGLFAPKSPNAAVAGSNETKLPSAPGQAGTGKASANNTSITPIENRGQVVDASSHPNLAVNERTGEVLDDDTGEVLTVTTTTTTTTTTETRRSRSPQPPANGNRGNETVSETTTTRETKSNLLDPAAAARPTNGSLQHSQSGSTLVQSNSNSSAGAGSQRSPSGQWPLPVDEQAPRKSAIENLKSAATGLQDVRNTLKGTVNSDAIPVPRRNPARSSRASATQQAPPPQQAPPLPQQAPPPHPSGHPPALIPGYNKSPAPGQSHWSAPWPEPPSSESTMEDGTGAGESEGLKKRKSLTNLPASFSPESSGQLGREKSPRLFKRAKNKKGAI